MSAGLGRCAETPWAWGDPWEQRVCLPPALPFSHRPQCFPHSFLPSQGGGPGQRVNCLSSLLTLGKAKLLSVSSSSLPPPSHRHTQTHTHILFFQVHRLLGSELIECPICSHSICPCFLSQGFPAWARSFFLFSLIYFSSEFSVPARPVLRCHVSVRAYSDAAVSGCVGGPCLFQAVRSSRFQPGCRRREAGLRAGVLGAEHLEEQRRTGPASQAPQPQMW